MIPPRSVETLVAQISGNVTDQQMVSQRSGRVFGSPGIEAGGQITLGTSEGADVVVTDATGKVLYNDTVTEDVSITAGPHGVQGPITVTVTNNTDNSHTLTVYWSIKR